MKRLFVALLVAALGCSRRESQILENDAAPACVFPGSNEVGRELFCREPGARRYTAYISSQRPTAALEFVAVSVVHEGHDGGSTLDGSDPALMTSELRAWLACAHHAGQHPVARVTFCALPDQAVGLKVRARLVGVRDRVDLGGDAEASARNLLDIRLVDAAGEILALNPALHWERVAMREPPRAEHVLHVGGTRAFCGPDLRQAVEPGCEPDPVVAAFNRSGGRSSSSTIIYGGPPLSAPTRSE